MSETDTADLVNELRADAANCRAEKDGGPMDDVLEAQAQRNETIAAALEAAQAREKKLEAELAEVKRERDAYKSSRWHWKQTAVRFAERSNERLARAEAAEEVADNLGEMSRQFANELIAAEASLAAANERVKELEAEVETLRNSVTWKRGETAPRDGTVILGRWDGMDKWRIRYDRGWFYADGEQSECPQPVWWRHETAARKE